MTKFKFTATTPDGATVTGMESALTVGMARRALLAKDLLPVDVREKKNLLSLEITKKKVKRKELMHFSRQMAVFMRAGIPVLESMEVMTDEVGDKVFQRVLAEMSDSLRAGETFAGAADEHPEAFPPYYLGILRSAELTGNLDIVLDQLSEYIERDLEAKRKVTSALVYPDIVMVMAVIAVVVIDGFVLPRFKTFFASLDAKLPLPTRMLLSVANIFTNDWYILVGIVVVIAASVLLLILTTKGRELRDTILLLTPILGDLITTAIL